MPDEARYGRGRLSRRVLISANCRFTLQVVPTEVGIQDGDYMRRGRQVRAKITVVTATVISARKE